MWGGRSEEPEDPEINGLTCPGYYERKLEDVEAKLAEERAGRDDAYRKMRRHRMRLSLVAVVACLVVAVALGWRPTTWQEFAAMFLR
jgi:hypothetical protein